MVRVLTLLPSFQQKDYLMQNPYFRAVSVTGQKIDVNLNQVLYFSEDENGETLIKFVDNSFLRVKESAQTIRGRTRKTWPSNEEAQG